ncbi:8027_t:CDS:2 [Funneliformis geosporum]|uniref:8027_t:CDS:1 n=1 Tax=Funneliformis geosporum TaxID=1117311 RepID=A0A9W4WMD1_9GLOM|nr:8027_t:CDS:2 [Funneliformis geosporum]
MSSVIDKKQKELEKWKTDHRCDNPNNAELNQAKDDLKKEKEEKEKLNIALEQQKQLVKNKKDEKGGYGLLTLSLVGVGYNILFYTNLIKNKMSKNEKELEEIFQKGVHKGFTEAVKFICQKFPFMFDTIKQKIKDAVKTKIKEIVEEADKNEEEGEAKPFIVCSQCPSYGKQDQRILLPCDELDKNINFNQRVNELLLEHNEKLNEISTRVYLEVRENSMVKYIPEYD